jgi:hypothetical protein
MKVNKIKEQINSLLAEIEAIEKEITDTNFKILFAEILNLSEGVSNNFISGDDYADSRIYSKIEGVKNIRFSRFCDSVIVKVTSPKGFLVPERIKVQDVVYEIVFSHSDKFNENIDY